MPFLTRTDEQIVNQIKAYADDDFFGVKLGDLIFFLPFEHAKQFIRDPKAAEETDYEADRQKLRAAGELPADREQALAWIKGYMEFAWGKANNCRGLSANRSIDHLIARLWLIGEDDLSAKVTKSFEEDYDYYGKRILRGICEHFGWDWKAWDDGRWVNNEDDDGQKADTIKAAW